MVGGQARRVHRRAPGEQGSWRLVGCLVEPGPPPTATGLTTGPSPSDPELTSKPGPLGRSSWTWGRLSQYLGSHGELRFSSWLCDQVFTWPPDQPRHAAKRLDVPDRNQIAPWFWSGPHSRPTASLYTMEGNMRAESASSWPEGAWPRANGQSLWHFFGLFLHF